MLGKVSAEQLDHHDGIHQAFELEMMDMANKGTYCRIWQLQIVSNMLGQSVCSWFPNVDVPGFEVDHHILSRIIEPFFMTSPDSGLIMMWSKSTDDVSQFQHFVPVMQ